MTEVLLVSPIVNDSMRTPCYALGLLSAVLQKCKITTKVHHFEGNYDAFCSLLEAEKPKVICFSAVTINYKNCVKLNRFAKQISNSIVSIIGGHHVTACPEEAIKDGFDYVVRFLGETVLVQLVRGILDGKAENNPIVYSERLIDLDKLPYIDLNIFDSGKFVWRPMGSDGPEFGILVTSFGCVSNCWYCDGHSFWPIWRAMSVERVLKEVEYQLSALNLDMINIADSLVAINMESFVRLAEIATSLNRRGIKYVASFKPNLIARLAKENPSILNKICENLVVAPISADSGSLKLLREYRGGIRPEHIITTVREFEKRGVFTILHLVIGGLGETFDTIEETRKMVYNSGANLAIAQILTPHPGTPLFNWLNERGKITTYDWNQYDQKHLVFEHPNFQAQELEEVLYALNSEFKRELVKIDV
jgi:radical SAM superfamily enzyme YgiQ (UPF0313 family)